MKKRTRVLILVFMAGMMLVTVQPAMLFAGEAPPGYKTPWDPFIYPYNYTGTKLSGPLSIYYWPLGDSCYNIYYTVRLSERKNLYLYQGSTTEYCVESDPVDESGDIIIMPFLGRVVQEIFPNATDWKLTSIVNGIYHDELVYPHSRAFVADIVITVKVKQK